MNKLHINSNSTLDIMGLILFGASTKRDDTSTIGQFGTGLKYALATLIREDVKFLITINDQAVDITTETVTLTDDKGSADFERIMINGEGTSVTTSLGKDWTVSMALREIATNAMDTDDYYIGTNPTQQYSTKFAFEMDAAVAEFVDQRDQMFISPDRKPLITTEMGKIYSKTPQSPAAGVYCKDVLCVNSNEGNTAFDYECPTFSMSELRLVQTSWLMYSDLANLLRYTDDANILTTVLSATCRPNAIEKGIVIHLCSYSFSTGFLKDFLSDHLTCPANESARLTRKERDVAILVDPSVHESLRQTFDLKRPAHMRKKDDAFDVIGMTPRTTLNTAVEAMNKAGLGLRAEEIFFMNPADATIMGCVTGDKRIAVNQCLYDDQDELIKTLVEEYIHRKYDVHDATRAFQEAALTEILQLIERINTSG